MENEETQNDENKQKVFVCELCHFTCDYLSDWNRHISRQKHCNKNKPETTKEEKINEKNLEIIDFNCKVCNKIYKTSAGLWKHKKKCVEKKVECEDNINISSLTNNQLLILLLEQNKKLMDEYNDIKNIINNIYCKTT